MGVSNSKFNIDDDYLNEYVQLTYLTKGEIRYILKRFIHLVPENLYFHVNKTRLNVADIMEEFPQIKMNPFQDRLVYVFSSQHDDRFSFEDMLDLFSALSENCPDKVKALWAFKIFDLDEDSFITEKEIVEVIERLTEYNVATKNQLTRKEKYKIARAIVEEMDMSKTGGIAPLEFVHAVMKMPDFSECFTLRFF